MKRFLQVAVLVVTGVVHLGYSLADSNSSGSNFGSSSYRSFGNGSSGGFGGFSGGHK